MTRHRANHFIFLLHILFPLIFSLHDNHMLGPIAARSFALALIARGVRTGSRATPVDEDRRIDFCFHSIKCGRLFCLGVFLVGQSGGRRSRALIDREMSGPIHHYSISIAAHAVEVGVHSTTHVRQFDVNQWKLSLRKQLPRAH